MTKVQMVQHYQPLSGLSGTERLTHSIKNLIVSGLGEKYCTTFLQVISPVLPTKTRKIWKCDFQPLCWNSFLQSIRGTEGQQNTLGTAATLPTALQKYGSHDTFPCWSLMSLKSGSWLKLIGPLCWPVLSLFSPSTSQQNCVIQSTDAAFSPQTVLRVSTQPNTNLAYSSAALGNFYKVKTAILLFRLHLDIPVGAYLCAPGFWFLRSKLGSG